jgi:predicted dehydrogenase
MKDFNMKPCRWGIIGPGKIAQKFAKALPVAGNAILHAVASSNLSRAKSFAKQNGALKWYGSYEELAADPDIDAVYIATPHPFHMENALLCLNQGKPVLCEKPLALNRQQVQLMVDAARENNTFLMEAMWTRFLPIIEKTLELIAKGTIGTVHYARGDFGFYNPFDPDSRLFNLTLGGGSLLDVGVYPLSLCLLIAGKPDSITARAQLSASGADESCMATLQYHNGTTASAFSTLASFTSVTAEIAGTKGNIVIHPAWYKSNALTLSRTGEEPQTITLEPVTNGFEYEIREVMSCIQQGLIESPKMSHNFSLLLSSTMDDIRTQIGVKYPGED